MQPLSGEAQEALCLWAGAVTVSGYLDPSCLSCSKNVDTKSTACSIRSNTV